VVGGPRPLRVLCSPRRGLPRAASQLPESLDTGDPDVEALWRENVMQRGLGSLLSTSKTMGGPPRPAPPGGGAGGGVRGVGRMGAAARGAAAATGWAALMGPGAAAGRPVGRESLGLEVMRGGDDGGAFDAGAAHALSHAPKRAHRLCRHSHTAAAHLLSTVLSARNLIPRPRPLRARRYAD
jgi:hypothetical protein